MAVLDTVYAGSMSILTLRSACSDHQLPKTCGRPHDAMYIVYFRAVMGLQEPELEAAVMIAAEFSAPWEGAMAASSASDEPESGRRPARPKDKSVADFAADAAKDIATLLQTELQLLRAEISEKLVFTAVSAALIGGGALLLMATIVLLLQAAITGLVAFGLSSPVATLIVAAVTLVAGAGLVWLGINRLNLARLAPSKTLDQLQKDSNIANAR